jgi:hypothetical protein
MMQMVKAGIEVLMVVAKEGASSERALQLKRRSCIGWALDIAAFYRAAPRDRPKYVFSPRRQSLKPFKRIAFRPRFSRTE